MTRHPPPRRRPRTKEMLLPLPAGTARDISLGNHLALATMRDGQATADTMVALLRVLYMTFFMLDRECAVDDLALFIEVETVLNDGIEAAARGEGWQLPAERLPAIQRVVLRHDSALATQPKYRYMEAWDRLERFVRSRHASPLPDSRLRATGQ